MPNSAWFANVAWLLAATFSFAQENPSPHFEVASVKPAKGAGAVSGGPGIVIILQHVSHWRAPTVGLIGVIETGVVVTAGGAAVE